MKDREEAWSAIQKLALQSPHVDLLSNPQSIQKPWNFPPSLPSDHPVAERSSGDHAAGGRSSEVLRTDAVDDDTTTTTTTTTAESQAEAKPVPKVMIKSFSLVHHLLSPPLSFLFS